VVPSAIAIGLMTWCCIQKSSTEREHVSCGPQVGADPEEGEDSSHTLIGH
jgi:hypothetical protein